jgi:hypothetical protein
LGGEVFDARSESTGLKTLAKEEKPRGVCVMNEPVQDFTDQEKSIFVQF